MLLREFKFGILENETPPSGLSIFFNYSNIKQIEK